MSPQGQFAMIAGPTIRPLEKADRKLLAQCPTIGAAVRQALTHAGIQQETMAMWLGMSAGHFSNLLSGKKRFTADQLRKIVHWTGYDLPAQKFCADCGGQFWFDEKRALIAAKEAELIALRQEAA